jgi:hypothetical protein
MTDTSGSEQPVDDAEASVPESFAGLRVEVVERPNGSYVLYFSWPATPRDAPNEPDGADTDV